jgi:ABC-type transport system involved in multi-copper enzyme maturation permease subunit
MWLIIVWKTHVVHGRFFLAGLSILFTIATLLAFAFLVGVVTSSTGVSLMATYAIFFFSAILAAHDKISAAMSKEWAAKLVEGLYWVFPKTAQLGRATVAHVAGNQAFHGVGDMNLLAVYGSTALFGLAALTLASWLFSRKDF